jgi:hypothetical protein
MAIIQMGNAAIAQHVCGANIKKRSLNNAWRAITAEKEKSRRD